MRPFAIKKIETKYLFPKTAVYPDTLLRFLTDSLPPFITAIGNLDILNKARLALFCSVQCPESIMSKASNLANALSDSGITVIGGFHSPMEHKVLNTLLRSTNPLIICPARSIEGMHLPREYTNPLANNRLLLLSPCGKNKNRPTTETSILRNSFVAALADGVFIIHAASDSKTRWLAREIMAWEKPLYTLNNNENRIINSET